MVRVTSAYSDTFAVSCGCHCKRGSLYYGAFFSFSSSETRFILPPRPQQILKGAFGHISEKLRDLNPCIIEVEAHLDNTRFAHLAFAHTQEQLYTEMCNFWGSLNTSLCHTELVQQFACEHIEKVMYFIY